MKIVKASHIHKEAVVSILSPAFAYNKSILLIVKHPAKIYQLMNYAFEKALLHGEIYISEDLNCCALITFPKSKILSLQSIWLDIKLAVATIGLHRLFKIIRREATIKKYQPRKYFTHLWFIATRPELQGNGMGSTMLYKIFNKGHIKNKPVYLETSTPENLKLYHRFGFEVVATINTGFDLYVMKK